MVRPWRPAIRQSAGLARSPDGERLYVADAGNHALRSDRPRDGAVTHRRRHRRSEASRSDRRWSGNSRARVALGPCLAREPLWIAMAGMHQLGVRSRRPTCRPVAGTGSSRFTMDRWNAGDVRAADGVGARDGVSTSRTASRARCDRSIPPADRVRRIVGRGLFHFGDLDARGDSVRLQHVAGTRRRLIDGDEPAVYLADTYNNKIKRLDPRTREVITIAGSPEHGSHDGAGDDARSGSRPGFQWLVTSRISLIRTTTQSGRSTSVHIRLRWS